MNTIQSHLGVTGNEYRPCSGGCGSVRESRGVGSSPTGATCSGFLIKFRDGSQYVIPTGKFIEDEIDDTLNVWNKEMEKTGEYPPATPKQARKWAEDKFARPWHPADIEDLFAGTQWDQFADIAIKLPTESLSSDELWDSAEISFVTNTSTP